MKLQLNHLNPQQREAVLHKEGPLLILAGAGSGKTSTMSYRIASLIADRHIPGSAILGLSFTNKAARELKERVSKLVTSVSGKRATQGLTISTFHSLCVRILRQHADRLGFQKDFTIVDQSDQTDILKGVLKNIRIDERRFDVDTILFAIGQAKNKFLRGEAAQNYFLEGKSLAPDYAEATAAAFARYQDQLKVLNAMDFDDLLFHAVTLLEKHADVRDFYNLKFRYILVDEYQDTNPAQFKLLHLLTEYKQNICVVGDDDQSIYSWRGADAAHILEFGKHFPGARTITLNQNYRSTNLILEAANAVISNNSKRHVKELWSDRGEGEPLIEMILEEDRAESEYVADEILKRGSASEGSAGRSWKDFAVLYRSNAQSRLFEEALRMRKIPYKIVGALSFLDRKEIKDVLCYWRLVMNFKDDASLRRILNWPARGIGKTSVEALGTHAFNKGVSFFEVLGEADLVAPRGASGCAQLKQLVLQMRQRLDMTPANPEMLVSWARSTLEMIGVKKALEEESDDPVQLSRKWENVDELVNSLGMIKPDEAQIEGSLSGELSAADLLRDFLSRMALDAQEEEKDDDKKEDQKNQVTLLTLHGSKGLEYPIVFLVGWEEGILPHKRTIEEAQDFSEERRLAYVGITRARDHCIITRCKNRLRYGKAVPRTPSRFLEEIPKHLVLKNDQSFTPTFDTEEAKEQHEVKVKNFLADIRSRLGAGKSP